MARSGNRQVVGGVVYTLGANYLVRIINLAITVALARHVGPHGMGVVAAALITLELIDTIRDFGLREALIYERGLDDRYAATGFVVIQVISLLQALVMAAVGWAGPLIGIDPQLARLLRWLAIIFPLSALGSPQEAMLQRQSRYGLRALADLAGTLVKLVAALGLLRLGWDIDSIVVAMLAGIAVRSACLWAFSGWRPSVRAFGLAAVRPLLGYGKHIIAVNIMALLRLKGDQFLVGGLLGSAALGSYFLAARIPEIVIFGVNVAISAVAFPTFARILREGGSLPDAYLRTVRASLLLMAPASIGIAAISGQIVPILFGNEWTDTVRVLAILALGGIPLTLGWNAGDVFKASGRPHLLTAVTVLELAVAVPVVTSAVLLTRDIAVVAASMVLCEAISTGIRLWFMARHEATPVRRVLGAAAPIILSALVMGVAVHLAATALSGLAPVARLVFCVATGALTYAGLILVTDRQSIGELRALLARRG